MTVRERLYDASVHAARPLLGLAGLVSPKAGRTVAGRRNAASSLAAWARDGRREEIPLVWLHGASAGELAGAGPVVDRLRRFRELQLAVTYSSPSAEGAVERLSPDVAEFVPLDTRRDSRRALRALRPSSLVFAKTDVWPGLSASAEEQGVSMALVNATVDEGSSRLGLRARFLLSPAYGRLDRTGAATRGDAERLTRLGVRADRIRITGDAALDAALDRMEAASESQALRRLARWKPGGLPVLLAGSTWPADEDVLLAAVRSLRDRGQELTLVLVPHEPTAETVRRLTGRCLEVLGRRPRLWTEGGAGPEGDGSPAATEGGDRTAPPPLVVDTTGVLAELYGAADVAYVGGGFGSDGLHSVVEPAAAGVPVTFGPSHARWEAGRLLRRGAAAELDRPTAARILGELLRSPTRRSEMGRAAREFVEEGAGAAEAGARLVDGLLDEPGPRNG